MNMFSPHLGADINDLGNQQLSSQQQKQKKNKERNGANYSSEELIAIAKQENLSQAEKVKLIQQLVLDNANAQITKNQITRTEENLKPIIEQEVEEFTPKGDKGFLSKLSESKKALVANILAAATIGANSISGPNIPTKGKEPTTIGEIASYIQEGASKVGDLFVGTAHAADLKPKIKIGKIEIIKGKNGVDNLINATKLLELSEENKDKLVNTILRADKETNFKTENVINSTEKEGWINYTVSKDNKGVITLEFYPMKWNKDTFNFYRDQEEIENDKTTIRYDKESKTTVYGKGGKAKMEVEERGDDALITVFSANGGHREGDNGKGLKGSDRSSFDARISGKITDNISLGVGGKLGPKEWALLSYPGFDFGKYGKVVVFVENYNEKNSFNTLVGEKNAWENQDKIAMKYGKQVGDGVLNSLELEGIHIKGYDTEVFTDERTGISKRVIDTGDKVITKRTKAVRELTGTNIGGKKLQGIIRTIWKISENQKFTAGVQVTDRKYNDGKDLGTDIGAEVAYEAVIQEFNKLKLGVSGDKEERRYSTGLSRKIGGNGEIGVELYYKESEITEDDFGALVKYTYRIPVGDKKTNNKGYELFPKNGVGINEFASDFANEQASQGLDTPRRYEEEGKVTVLGEETNIKYKKLNKDKNEDENGDKNKPPKLKGVKLEALNLLEETGGYSIHNGEKEVTFTLDASDSDGTVERIRINGKEYEGTSATIKETFVRGKIRTFTVQALDNKGAPSNSKTIIIIGR